MSNKYYYLVASLPYLGFGAAPPFNRDYFISQCRNWLSENELNYLLAAKAYGFEINEDEKGLIKEWREFDLNLRDEAGRLRRERKLGHEKRIPESLANIFEQSTPFDMERAFEKMRWDFLEEKESDFFFDMNWLIIYFLKLQINERLVAFRIDEGERIFNETCEAMHG